MSILAHHARTWIEENEPPGSRFRVGADRVGGQGTGTRSS